MNIEQIKETITIVKDYPIKGIVFKDITTLLEDPEAFKSTVDIMIENFFRLSRSSYAEGLGALYAYERQVPEIADTKIKGLVDHYNVSSDEGLEYFIVHKDADVEHREQSAELMNKLSDEEKILAKEAGLSTVKVLWGFLSGLCEKHNIQA